MFKIHTDNHFKIWFSKDKDVFLDFENQLRLVRARLVNPEAKIHFIYSSKWLSTKAKDELTRFCNKHRITPVDFDTEIKNILKSKNDKKLYALAKKEIQFACENKGGNLAGASDCVRVILAVLKKYGIYTDHDVEINLSKKRKVLNIKSPVLIQAKRQANSNAFPELNTDTFAVARHPSDPSTLCDEGVKRTIVMQDEIIKRYENPKAALFNHTIKGATTTTMNDPNMARIVEHYFDTHPKASLFAFRRYIEKLTAFDLIVSMDSQSQQEVIGNTSINELTHEEAIYSLSANLVKQMMPDHHDISAVLASLDHHHVAESVLKTLRHKIGAELVFAISGPINLGVLYKDVIGDGEITNHKLSKLIKLYTNSGVDENFGKNCIQSNNSIATLAAQVNEKPLTSALDLIGITADKSWTLEGAQKKQERIDNMHQAAGTIQHAWRHFQKRKASQPSKPSRLVRKGLNLKRKRSL